VDHIYTVTVIQISDMEMDRCVGWYPTFEEAEGAVLGNDGDIFENCYDYAVIEKVPSGTFASLFRSFEIGKKEASYEVWYQAERDGELTVTRCNKPDELHNTIGFSMG
jgi:hypothetical protein